MPLQGDKVKRIVSFFLLFFVGLVIPSYSAEKGLTVAAASDLVFALKDISKEFERSTGIKVILSFGSTGQLAQQIAHGAPFDVFFAADEKYIEGLNEKGIIMAETKRLYAQGRIVLAVNKKSGVSADRLSGLLNPAIKRIAIANPAHAPYGIAAREALISSGLWERLSDKLVYGENIRQALQFIQTGDAQAGIVALSITDVPEITYTLIGASLHRPINQAVAVIRGSKKTKEARDFIGFVGSPAGRTIMKRYGFLLPEKF